MNSDLERGRLNNSDDDYFIASKVNVSFYYLRRSSVSGEYGGVQLAGSMEDYYPEGSTKRAITGNGGILLA